MIEPGEIGIAGWVTKEEKYAVRGAAFLVLERRPFPHTRDDLWSSLALAAGISAELARGRLSPDVRDAILALGRAITDDPISLPTAKKCLAKMGKNAPRPRR